MSGGDHYAREREKVFARAGWRCEFCPKDGGRCGNPATHTAHMIPARVGTLKKYGKAVIYSRHNLRAACGTPGMGGDHNGRQQLQSWQWDDHAALVLRLIEQDGP